MKNRIEDLLFNGYVSNPIPIALFALLVAVALILLAAWATIDSCRSIQVYSSVAEEVFTDCEYDGPIIELLTATGQNYSLPSKAVSDDSILNELIMSATPVRVEYTIPLDKTVSSRDVVAMSSLDGLYHVSNDVIAQARIENKYTSLIILWVVCLLYISFASSSYYFISHAPRFPHICALLVRKPYRNF